MGEGTILNKGNGCGEWTAGRKKVESWRFRATIKDELQAFSPCNR